MQKTRQRIRLKRERVIAEFDLLQAMAEALRNESLRSIFYKTSPGQWFISKGTPDA